MRPVVICTDPCPYEVERASGDVVCETCKKLYRNHPFCAGSKIAESMRSTLLYDEYSDHVLCDGRHVHL